MNYSVSINGQSTAKTGEADALLVLSGRSEGGEGLDLFSLVALESKNVDSVEAVKDMSDKTLFYLTIALMGHLAEKASEAVIENFCQAVLDSMGDQFFGEDSRRDITEGDVIFEE